MFILIHFYIKFKVNAKQNYPDKNNIYCQPSSRTSGAILIKKNRPMNIVILNGPLEQTTPTIVGVLRLV